MKSSQSTAEPFRRPGQPAGFDWARVWIALAFVLVGILTRVPFRSEILHHWDSVNFALALDQYDVRLHQPHPPGTFVLYILLGRLFYTFIPDANAALTWLSVALSGLGAAALYLLAEIWFDRRTALIAGLLALTSPLVWFHGEVALSYMLEFFWVPVVIYACYRMQGRSLTALLVSALLIGVSGGVRPNTPVFLFPLWLLAVLAQRFSWKQVGLAFGIMGVGVLVWATPMVMWSGGPLAYLEQAIWWQSQHTEEAGSLLGMLEYMARFGVFLFYALGLGLFALAWAGLRLLSPAWQALRRVLAPLAQPGTLRQRASAFLAQPWDWRFLVIIAWLLPGTAYLTIVHLRQSGHMFTIIPGYLLLTALAIGSLAGRGRWANGLALAIAGANVVFFLAAPDFLFGQPRMLLNTPSWNSIRNYDQYVTTRFDALRANFAPGETAVLASSRNLRLPDFYLRDYQYSGLSHQIDSERITLAAPVRQLVVLDEDAVLPPLPDGLEWQSLALPDGGRLRSVTWDADQVLVIQRDRIELQPK